MKTQSVTRAGRRVRLGGRVSSDARIPNASAKADPTGASAHRVPFVKHVVVLTALFCGLCLCADAPKPAPYLNSFEQTPPGKPPEELLILNGEFTVTQVDGNKCLELAPDPLDGDGLLFGPPGLMAATISARIWATSTGKRFPEFGIGANDAGGYKLILMPAQNLLELRRGDDSKASAPLIWKPQTWTKFKLHVGKLADGKVQVEGKAWPEGSPEPKEWAVSFVDAEPMPPGRASAWGMPYAGKPIRFDDLGVTPE